jgi:hypothetical protein
MVRIKKKTGRWPSQKFRVGVGVYVAAGLVVQELDELGRIYEIAVYAHRQAEWGIDEKGLSFRWRRCARSGISHVGDSHEARHLVLADALAFVKDLAGHAEALALVDSSTLAHGDTSGILSTLLLGRLAGSVRGG